MGAKLRFYSENPAFFAEKCCLSALFRSASACSSSELYQKFIIFPSFSPQISRNVVSLRRVLVRDATYCSTFRERTTTSIQGETGKLNIRGVYALQRRLHHWILRAVVGLFTEMAGLRCFCTPELVLTLDWKYSIN